MTDKTKRLSYKERKRKATEWLKRNAKKLNGKWLSEKETE